MGEKLTRRALDAWLKSETNSQWLWCGELRGFGAHRRENGRAAFIVQLRVGHGRLAQRRRVVLGEYPTMPPESARQQAAELVSAGWKGTDVVATKRDQQAAQARRRDTLAEMAKGFHAARRRHLKGRSADQYESLWRRLIIPDFGTTAVSDMKRREVANIMDRIEQSAGTSVADRVHEQLGTFFRWYAQRDDEFTSPLVRAMKRHRRGTGARPMTDDELKQFWFACADAGLAGTAGRLCLLTATRRSETTNAVWLEIADVGVWTIPSTRYKTRREHVVPLSHSAQVVMSKLEVASPYLFGLTDCAPDPWTLWNTIVDAGGPCGGGLSWHSLRKTARTLMSRAGVRSEHAERALGHVQGAVERAYDKHGYFVEKRAAFEALASEIECIVNGRRSLDGVIPLTRAAA